LQIPAQHSLGEKRRHFDKAAEREIYMSVNSILKSKTVRQWALFRSLILFVCVAGIVTSGLVLAKGGWLQLRNYTSPNSTAAQPVKMAEPQITSLRVALWTHGFDPREITIPKGTYLLSVSNRTEIDDLSFEFNRVGHGRLHAVKEKKERPEWSRLFELQPGDYQLAIEGRPNWLCRITVTAQD
jgi:hypothetical protein